MSARAADYPQRPLEVVVVGDDDGDLGVLTEGVEQQVGGEVHVGALLLRSQNLDDLWRVGR